MTVTGWVDELAPELARAAVVVAPLRSGGGTKLKVLEALAAGRPVVATTVGAEGIEVGDGEHLLVADGARPSPRRSTGCSPIASWPRGSGVRAGCRCANATRGTRSPPSLTAH